MHSYSFERSLRIALFALASFGFGCQESTQSTETPTHSSAFPSEWYQLPEDQNGLGVTHNGGPGIQGVTQAYRTEGNRTQERTSKNNVAKHLQQIFLSNERVLHELPLEVDSWSHTDQKPNDFVPWHLEAITTDLGLSVQGLLGVLTVKGSPFASVYWRRKGVRSIVPSIPTSSPISSNNIEELPMVHAHEGLTSLDVESEVSGVIRAALATGKIKNPKAFEQGLRNAIEDFHAVAQSIPLSNRSKWWISGFRFDLSVDSEGRIYPFMSVGGGLRLRFDWRRIMRNTPVSTAGSRPINVFSNHFRKSLVQFVVSMESVLEEASNEYKPKRKGFVPYFMRVAIGLSGNGSVGIAKGSASAVGSVLFARDVIKPSLRVPDNPENPIPRKAPHPGLPSPSGPSILGILMVENDPSPAHLRYAIANEIPFHRAPSLGQNSIEQAVYEISKDRIKAGIKKSLKIGGFLARQTYGLRSGRWKVYEIRTSFEFSISGSAVLVGVGGSASADMALYNEDF